VQKIVREELQTAFAKYHPNGAEGVVVDPATGDVLAMVSLPTFDPNAATQLPAGAREHIGAYQVDRCASNVYEPGSTLKTFAIASAIDNGTITPDTYFHCGGGIRVKNRTIHDSHSEVHGDLNPEGILTVSCNVCTAQIGMKMGLPALYSAARQFGLGEKLGTHLPLEQAGTMRLPELKQYEAQAARVAFGQSITTTPLHLAMGYAAIANHGVLMKPRLITELTRGGEIVKRWAPERVRQAISERTSDQMMHMLGAVVTRGTGRPAAVRGYTVAGKTGTASKYRPGAYVGSFIGVVPASASAKFRAVILVALDEPHGAFYGADVAAPVFKQIASRLMSLRGVAEDDPTWTQFKAAHTPVRARD
jgi:cell division protein FtsI/penicillin-binding protein 2